MPTPLNAQNAILNSIQKTPKKIDMHKFPYKWNLADTPAKGIEKHGTKVFTTFSCGGGSSFGYKLAGYDVIAANDIDKQMKRVYLANHKPKHYIFGGIEDLITKDLPTELFGIDIFDGSPPCSVFSMSGSRDKAWGKDKKFREGQATQVLDDLFFQFIAVAERLQPKIIIAENVKGMLVGHAKWYTREVVRRLDAIGYTCQVFLLNAARMGVPQRRERVFFIATKKEYGLPKLKMTFDEPPIYLKDFIKDVKRTGNPLTEETAKLWAKTPPGKALSYAHPKGHRFNAHKVDIKQVCGTLSAGSDAIPIWHDEPRRFGKEELSLVGSFPQDYNYDGVTPAYLIGMSVPPVMMAQVSHQVFEQWVKPLKQQGIIK